MQARAGGVATAKNGILWGKGGVAMTTGEVIQTCRARRNLSQERLAELVGVSRQAVSKWEVGGSLR